MAEIRFIDTSDTLFRRVLHRADQLEWHDDLGRWVPALAAVRFDPDGMSTFVQRLLHEIGSSVAAVPTLAETAPADAVAYGIGVEETRQLSYEVTHTPDELTPIGEAHASVLPPPGLSRADSRALRTDLAAAMKIAHGVVRLPRPSGA